MRYDAIVIGAGPAGSSVAMTLARQGWSIAIIEKSEFPRRKVCGEFISATNIALLARFGLNDAWLQAAGPEIRRVGLFAGETCVETDMPQAQSGAFGRALGRDVFDAMLLDAARAAGAEIFQPWRATSLHKQGDCQLVSIESPGKSDRLSASIVIGAHGSWEPGKLPSQLEKAHRPSDLLGFKAHFTASSLPTQLMPLLVFPGGYGGMVWADRGRMSISCCIRRDMLAEIRKSTASTSAAEAVHRHLMKSCRGVKEAIGDATLDGPWLAAGPMLPGIRTCYAQDVFRVGNAAGESHPIIAEGITMAMQSGWLLASELALAKPDTSEARMAVAERYSAEWRRMFTGRIYAAEAFARIAAHPTTAASMRSLIQIFPGVLALGARLGGKTKELPGPL